MNTNSAGMPNRSREENSSRGNHDGSRRITETVFTSRVDRRPSDLSGQGWGRAGCHIGEIWQGAIRDRQGVLRRSLCTLPSQRLGSLAEFELLPDSPLSVSPAGKHKAFRGAAATLRALNHPNSGGRLSVYSQLDEGVGMGSSTSEILASVRAVAHAVGATLSQAQEKQILLEVDGAVDPIFALNRPMVIEHRKGEILIDFGVPWPPFDVLAFDTTPKGNGVDTSSFRVPDYSRRELDCHAALVGDLSRAMITQDIELLGHVATESAAINQRSLPKNKWKAIRRFAVEFGSVGIAAAHTGTVCAFILPPAKQRSRASAEEMEHALESIGCVVVLPRGPR